MCRCGRTRTTDKCDVTIPYLSVDLGISGGSAWKAAGSCDTNAVSETLQPSAPQAPHQAEVELLRLQLDLERLDHAWDNERQSMLIHGKRGGVFEPTVGFAWWNGGIFLLLGLFMVSQSVDYGGRGGVTGVLLLPAVIAIAGGVYIIVKRTADARRFAERRHAYLAEREALAHEVDAAAARLAATASGGPHPA